MAHKNNIWFEPKESEILLELFIFGFEIHWNKLNLIKSNWFSNQNKLDFIELVACFQLICWLIQYLFEIQLIWMRSHLHLNEKLDSNWKQL